MRYEGVPFFHTSYFILHPCCRLAQLPIFGLEAEQTGTFAALLLRRGEDCALLPLEMVQWSVEGQGWREPMGDVAHSLRQLERDGWELYGKIEIRKDEV